METLILVAAIATSFYVIDILYRSFRDDMSGLTEEKLHDMKKLIEEDEHFHK